VWVEAVALVIEGDGGGDNGRSDQRSYRLPISA
jgi:hypothetical protein